MMKNKAILVFPLMIFSLLLAVWSGWLRIGWNFPVTNVAAQHGALMVNSFLASLIFLERAVTFRNKWVLLLPFINAASTLAFIFNLPTAAQLMFIAGSSGFVIMCSYFICRYKETYYIIFLAGAICLLVGNIILFKTNFFPNAVTWWIGFLLITIVAERLELSRFLALSNFKRSLLWICILLVIFALAWPFHLYGNIFLSVAIAATALWLLKFDMAKHSIKVKGQHRYSGLLLIVGYAWLLVMAGFLILQNRLAFRYDAVLHSFFIGFVFSMIFSHAVIVLPAVTGLVVKVYRPILYLWFVLLQASLIVRIVSDVVVDVLCRKIAGMANGLSILLFFVSMAVIMRNEIQKRKLTATAGEYKKLATA